MMLERSSAISGISAVVLLVLTSLQWAGALPTQDWKRRSIYQVITDRFAKEAGKPDTCDELYDRGEKCTYGNYCGGTFDGIADKLDYIQGMGFDAIWISPVVSNTPCGYHGYWTQNLHKINPRFGGDEGLKKFVDAAHARGIAVMFDSVLNHVGPASKEAVAANSYAMYTPFDKQEYFHGTYANHSNAEHAPLTDGQSIRETGWMGYASELPDLAQDKFEVAQILVDWVKGLRAQYQIDGFRMDALPYVNKSFYQMLKKDALAGIFATGEVVIGGKGIDFAAGYQHQDPADKVDKVEGAVLDSVINYDLQDTLKHVFQEIDWTVELGPMHSVGQKPYDQPVTNYVDEFRKASANYKDVGALANFVSVHDQPRWMYRSPNWRTYKNAFVATFFLPGVPINYYGDEQGVRGGNMDNTCRPPLWRTGYDQSHPLYLFTKSVISARKEMLKSLSDKDIDDVKHLTATAYAMSFQRGTAVLVVQKVLPAAMSEEVINVMTDYEEGTVLCDALEGSNYCVTVGEAGTFKYMLSGLPKMLFPKAGKYYGVPLSERLDSAAVPTWAVPSLALVGFVTLAGMAWRSSKWSREGEIRESYSALA